MLSLHKMHGINADRARYVRPSVLPACLTSESSERISVVQCVHKVPSGF
jgi:hypothetical protein